MKKIILLIIVALSINVNAQNCVKNISTNPVNAVNTEFDLEYPNQVNNWLNTFAIYDYNRQSNYWPKPSFGY